MHDLNFSNFKSLSIGLTWSFEGSQADMRESTGSLWGGFAMAMLLIYVLLALAFGSYSQPSL